MVVSPVKENDYADISQWFRARGMGVPPRWSFSSRGYIVRGHAAGFLYLTNSAVARLDMFISNPDADHKQNDEALNAITSHLIMVSRKKRVKLLSCTTKIQAIKDRAMMFGFKDSGPCMGFYKEL